MYIAAKEKEQSLPVIKIDNRERSSQLAAILRERKVLQVVEDTLACGDVVVSAICIERKTVQDFQRSVVDGRLFRQLATLRTMYQRCLLLIEEDAMETGDSLHLHAAQGALLKITAGWQVPYMLSANTFESAGIIEQLALQEVKAAGGILVGRPGLRRKGRAAQMRHLLEAIPDIGPKRADALLLHFGCLKNIFAVDSHDLLSVPGISHSLAKSIKDFFRCSY